MNETPQHGQMDACSIPADPPEALVAPVSDARMVENVRWLCHNMPWFFDGQRLEDLKPSIYPEHQVIVEFLKNRGRIQNTLSSPAKT